MRFAFVVFLLTAVGTGVFAKPATLELVRVWPGYRTAESFERIGEYFTGREQPGREIILRSRPDARAGYYFLARLKNSDEDITGATIELKVITPDAPEPRTFTFTIIIPTGSHAFHLGLTGTDWPNRNAHPVAWLLTVRSSAGIELIRRPSFLWEKPESAARER